MDDSEIEEQARFDRQQKIRQERDDLLATLKRIHELAAEDLRVRRVFVCHSHLYAIEAVAGVVIARVESK